MDPTAFYSELPRALARLPPERRAIFAATCAERLAGSPNVRLAQGVREALDALWNGLRGQHLEEEELSRALASLETLVRDEDALDDLSAVIADDALAAVIFALRTRIAANADDAHWAGRRAWDAVDYYLTHQLLPDASEDSLRAHPLVAREVARQQRDLGELGDASKKTEELAQALRERAQSEANRVLANE